MNNYRENYFVARNNVFAELNKKYNLIESHKDENRLTLNSSKYSIHLVLYIPDGVDLIISPINREPAFGNNFMHYLHSKYPENDIRRDVLKDIYKNSRAKSSFDNSIEAIEDNFLIMINFIHTYFPDIFS